MQLSSSSAATTVDLSTFVNEARFQAFQRQHNAITLPAKLSGMFVSQVFEEMMKALWLPEKPDKANKAVLLKRLRDEVAKVDAQVRKQARRRERCRPRGQAGRRGAASAKHRLLHKYARACYSFSYNPPMRLPLRAQAPSQMQLQARMPFTTSCMRFQH